jgi:dienelactone hydrolase
LSGFCIERLVFFVLVMQLPLHAQERVNAVRADGHMTPLKVYPSVGSDTGCAPLAIISHGAGGSENGYRYLAESMSHMGFTAVAMGHRESGMAALRDEIRVYGLKQGVRRLVTARQAEEARLLDVGAALQWADRRCSPPYRVLLGHSMGSETVMLEAGARNMIGVPSPPAGQDRFDAYVALSPEGPGIVFPGHGWSNIRKPLLILTGTRDQAIEGGASVADRPHGMSFPETVPPSASGWALSRARPI